jgi:hypothetical protein
VSEKPAPTPGVHLSWPADEAAALRAVMVECPPHIDLTMALWGASVALQRRRAAVVEQPEADLDGYWRGRQEALLEAVALAELHGAHVIAKHLRSWYEAGAAARQSAPGRTVTNPDSAASS